MPRRAKSDVVATIFRVVAVTSMMTMHALEHRARAFIAAFAVGCVLSSAYGFLPGAWPSASSNWSGPGSP